MTVNELMIYISESRYMQFVEEDATEALDDLICSRPDLEELLADRARTDLVDIYKSRIIPIYVAVMMRQIIRHMGYSSLSGADAEDKLEAAYDAIMGKMSCNPKDFLQENYPLTKEWDEVISRNTYDSWIEMLDRFMEDREEIQTPHHHGRSVAGIQTDAGCLYYKPHDCSIDVAYGEVVTKLFSDCTATPKCIAKAGYGYMTELKSRPLKKKESPADYYHNFGILLALFHAIGTTDMHCENVMACGVKPAAIDIETILSPIVKSTGDYGGKTITSRIQLEMDGMNNIYKTGVFPVLLHKMGVFSPLYRNDLTHDMHLPSSGDEHFEVTGYEKEFIQGFHEGYSRVLKNKETIQKIISKYPNATIRYVPKNTAYYSKIRDMLFLTDALTSVEGRQAVLAKLEVPYTASRQDVNKAVVNHEVQCLLAGDIPYFCVSLAGRDLCGLRTDQLVESGYMESSAQEKVIWKLGMLSEEDEEYEARIIENALTRVLRKVEKEEPFPIEDVDKSPDGWSIKEELARELLHDTIPYTDGSVLWNHVPMHFMRWRSCGAITEWGQVSRFIAEAAGPESQLPEELKAELTSLGVKCMAGINLKISLWEKEDPEVLGKICSSNIFRGVGGLLIDFNQMTDAGFEGAEAMLRRFLKLISSKKLHIMKDESPADAAGLLMALCHINLYNISSEEVRKATLPLIQECLDHMLRNYAEGEEWSVRDKAFMAAAYAMAHKVTQVYDALVMSEKLIKEVRDEWNGSAYGWKEERTRIHWAAPKEAGFMQTGNMIAMAGFHLPVSDAKDMAAEIVGLVAEKLYNRDTLWHLDTLEYGNGLAVEILRISSVVLEEPKYEAKADAYLNAMIARYKKKGCFTNMPDGLSSFFDFYYMGGSLSWSRF